MARTCACQTLGNGREFSDATTKGQHAEHEHYYNGGCLNHRRLTSLTNRRPARERSPRMRGVLVERRTAVLEAGRLEPEVFDTSSVPWQVHPFVQSIEVVDREVSYGFGLRQAQVNRNSAAAFLVGLQ